MAVITRVIDVINLAEARAGSAWYTRLHRVRLLQQRTTNCFIAKRRGGARRESCFRRSKRGEATCLIEATREKNANQSDDCGRRMREYHLIMVQRMDETWWNSFHARSSSEQRGETRNRGRGLLIAPCRVSRLPSL